RRAVVAVVERVVVALLLADAHAVAERRIEQRRAGLGVAHEAATAHEHDRAGASPLVVRASSSPMAAGDVGELDPVMAQMRLHAQHAVIDSDNRARMSKPAATRAATVRASSATGAPRAPGNR